MPRVGYHVPDDAGHAGKGHLHGHVDVLRDLLRQASALAARIAAKKASLT